MECKLHLKKGNNQTNTAVSQFTGAWVEMGEFGKTILFEDHELTLTGKCSGVLQWTSKNGNNNNSNQLFQWSLQ